MQFKIERDCCITNRSCAYFVGFPRSSDLQCHRRTHTGEKPCLCTICGKGFSRSNKLVRHMRIHTGVRPYQCTCKFSSLLLQQSVLDQNISSKLDCDRAFTQSNDLTLHIRRHTGEKPYVCAVCGDRFIQGTALKQHQRMQNHYEGSQPTPYSSISVNNPSRFTNSNLVNRRYCIDQPNQPESPSPPQAIKPVIPRRRANNVASGISQIPTQQQMTPSTSMMGQIVLGQDTIPSDVMSLRSPSPPHSSTHTPVSTPIPHNLSQIDIKPNIQNLNLPQYNGMPLPNIPSNIEIATLFFNQNFNQQSHQNN
jgi:Zinc finger, C2H2 type